MNWVIILIAIVGLFIAAKLIHFKHLKHKIVAIFVILLLLFFYLSFSGVVNSSNIDLNSPSGVASAAKIYVSWLGSLIGNLKTITGNIVRMDWSPKNSTG